MSNDKTKGSEKEHASIDRSEGNFEKFREYWKRFLAHKRQIIIFNLIITVLTVLYLFLIASPYFISTVTIFPEFGAKSATLSQLSSLATLAGVSVGEKGSTEIYQNLIKGEAILEPVIYTLYKTELFSDSVNLIDYFEIEPDEALSGDLQKRKMFLEVYKYLTEKAISTSVERLTKILTVEVNMPESRLSAEVANNIVNSLDNYIRTQRKSTASEQRYYLEKRVEQVKDSLQLSENKLKYFREQNRVVLGSPQLLLEQERLIRNVAIFQNVFLELTKQLEIAKIDEINDMPVINLKEYAREPVIKAGPARLKTLIIVLFFSVILSVLFFVLLPEIRRFILLMKN